MKMTGIDMVTNTCKSWKVLVTRNQQRLDVRFARV